MSADWTTWGIHQSGRTRGQVYVRLVSEVRVVDTGLERWATECETLAAGLVGGLRPAPAVGPQNQATSKAVLSAHSRSVGFLSALSNRLQTTGVKSHLAAIAYAENDHDSAEKIAGLPTPSGG